MGGEGAQLSAASKVALVGVSSLCISATSILLRQAEHNDEIAFSPIAASFFGELMKASVAFVMMACTPSSFAQARKVSGRTAGLFLLPAFLYVLTNNLRFFIVRAVNPGIIGVMWNLKIVRLLSSRVKPKHLNVCVALSHTPAVRVVRVPRGGAGRRGPALPVPTV